MRQNNEMQTATLLRNSLLLTAAHQPAVKHSVAFYNLNAQEGSSSDVVPSQFETGDGERWVNSNVETKPRSSCYSVMRKGSLVNNRCCFFSCFAAYWRADNCKEIACQRRHHSGEHAASDTKRLRLKTPSGRGDGSVESSPTETCGWGRSRGCLFTTVTSVFSFSPALINLPRVLFIVSSLWVSLPQPPSVHHVFAPSLPHSCLFSCALCVLAPVFWTLYFASTLLDNLHFWTDALGLPDVCIRYPAFHKSSYWTSLSAISVFGSEQCLASGTTIILNSDNLEALHDSIIKLHRKATIIHADPTFSQTSCSLPQPAVAYSAQKGSRAYNGSFWWMITWLSDCGVWEQSHLTLTDVSWCELMRYVCMFL